MATQSDIKPIVSAASPTGLVPTLGGARQPSLCIKPMPTAASPTPPSATSPPVSLTSKEWVIPPRPKPGRKPATDTPPTKRKAQNRAAQRAFRERRAARVGELEEQIKQIEDEHEQEQDNLRTTVSELEERLERCQADLASWMNKCHKLEAELAESRARLAKQNHNSLSASRSRDGSSHVDQTTSQSDAYGCGKCTIDSHCQCIDDVVQAMSGDIDGSQVEKRARTPPAESAHKRIKTEPTDNNEMEIDFTAAYSKTAGRSRPEATSTTSAVADPCGFCQDGTPCICAEMAAEQDRRATGTTRPNSPVASNRPTARQLAQFTPPPSEGDVATNLASVAGRCGAKPGTCAQCRADPNSTLFCKSLAASREQSNSTTQGCCGGRGADGGCCQGSIPLPARNTRSRTAAANSIQLPPPNSKAVTLTCADAYTALSRHSAYERASSEMASWMPKLHANPATSESRPAMEIDAANVMAVLKDFDRRFGANK